MSPAWRKVLIVEDDMHLRFFLHTVFESGGYATETARNGREGVDKARREKPDLISLDLMMPRQGGVNMYRELKSDPELQDIPVIILSGVEAKAFDHALRMLNVSRAGELPQPEAYLEKPPVPERVLQEAERILRDRGKQ